MMAPIRNAPNSRWMPRYSLHSAEIRTSSIISAIRFSLSLTLRLVDALIPAQQRPDAVDHDEAEDSRDPPRVIQIEVLECAERIRTTM